MVASEAGGRHDGQERMMEAPPIIMHGLRVHAREHRGPTGVRHACNVQPLDRLRSRPKGWWMLDEQTGRRFGLIEGVCGETVKADDLNLDELIMLTAVAPSSRHDRRVGPADSHGRDLPSAYILTGAQR